MRTRVPALRPAMRPPTSQSALEFVLEYERRSHLQSILARLDKMTMAHGLEARAPFMDYQLILWAKRLNAWAKVGPGWQNKRLLKREAARHFSRTLVYRGKVGFGVPLQTWFRREPRFREMLAVLGEPNSFVSGLFDRSVIRTIVDDHCVKSIDRTAQLWALLNLEVWARTVLVDPGTSPGAKRGAGLAHFPDVCRPDATESNCHS